MQILVSLFVANLIGFDWFEGEFNVIILLEPMSLRKELACNKTAFRCKNDVLYVKRDIFLHKFQLKC